MGYPKDKPCVLDNLIPVNTSDGITGYLTQFGRAIELQNRKTLESGAPKDLWHHTHNDGRSESSGTSPDECVLYLTDKKLIPNDNTISMIAYNHDEPVHDQDKRLTQLQYSMHGECFENALYPTNAEDDENLKGDQNPKSLYMNIGVIGSPKSLAELIKKFPGWRIKQS